ncbi:MAG: ATP synthase F1 subunit delta [Cyanobacteria bacterium RUI128]|nr:ATP synthase F1 subunit delta [Cyanobacteria bacterium RUI128]
MAKAVDNENKLVAKRYAKALLELSNERLTKEQILSEISDASKSLDGSEDLKKVMSSPVIPSSEKNKVLIKVFENNVSEIVLNFLRLLVDKDRFSILKSIVSEYRDEINRLNNMLDIKVTSAIDLNENEKAMIKVKLKSILNKDIELDWATDSSIIGGLVFEAGDNIVDNSLRYKLQEISRNIVK